MMPQSAVPVTKESGSVTTPAAITELPANLSSERFRNVSMIPFEQNGSENARSNRRDRTPATVEGGHAPNQDPDQNADLKLSQRIWYDRRAEGGGRKVEGGEHRR